jgi:hypothetical protein
MKTYHLKREQTIDIPREKLFRFFESPENLERITPDDVGFEILTPGPITMQTGTVLDYTIRLLGLPVRWTTLIASYDPPHKFTDVALKGPYSYWHHTHTFEETAEGTLMTDDVKYAVPFGCLGRLVHSLWVRRQLNEIFDFRAGVMEQLLEAEESSGQPVQLSGQEDQ